MKDLGFARRSSTHLASPLVHILPFPTIETCNWKKHYKQRQRDIKEHGSSTTFPTTSPDIYMNMVW